MLANTGAVLIKYRGRAVIRFSVTWFCNATLRIQPISQLAAGVPLRDIAIHLQGARSAVDDIRSRTILSSVLRSSISSAVHLIGVLDAVIGKITDTAVLDHTDAANISLAVQQWWISFAAEMDVLDTYFVRRKGGFDTLSLVESGETVFQESLNRKVPESIDDIKMGTRCLAFTLWTASSFHFIRATEAVVHKYFAAIAQGHMRPRLATIGAYVRRLKRLGLGDPKTLSALESLNDFYRTPNIHVTQVPKVDSIDAALGLLYAAHTAIGLMLTEIPDQPVEVVNI
jgi:hypothetical protein